MNRRVKEIRVALGLSQDAFGAKLGLKRAAVSRIESGAVNLTETNVILICERFNVNRDWLLNGTGEMFLPESSDSLDALAEQYDLTPLEREIFENYCKLSKAQRLAFSAWFRGSGCRGRLRKELWYCIRHPRCRSYEYARRHRVK